MTFSDGLAVAAIALSLSTIFFGVLFYRWQTEQGARISDTVNNFAKEMHAVLGEIKGLTTGTREELQDQFRWLLEAAIGQERVSVARELGERVAAVEDRLAGLGGGLSPEAKQQLDGVMRDLRREVETLAKDIEALRHSAPPEPPSAGLGSVKAEHARQAVRRLLGGQGPWVLAVHPKRVQPGGRLRVEQVGWIPAGDFETLEFTVTSPDGGKWTARLLQDLRGPGGADGFNFPDDFSGASTDVLGSYRVSAQRVSLDGVSIGEPLVANFFVEQTAGEGQG